jgi:hypothetical protein
MDATKQAIQDKNEAIGQALRALESIMAVTKWPEGRQRLAGLLADFNEWEGEEGVKDADETFIQPALDAIKAYDEAHERLLIAAVKGESL